MYSFTLLILPMVDRIQQAIQSSTHGPGMVIKVNLEWFSIANGYQDHGSHC